MTYADLGGLGTKQGVPVLYDWARPNPIPQLLPWLAVLALLALKPNRRPTAWWILIPLTLVGGVAFAPQSALDLLPTSQMEPFLGLIGGLGFGLAAVWLLSGYLVARHRMLAFLGVLLVQEVFGLLAFGLRQAAQGVAPETFVAGICLAISILVTSVGLSLAGLLCRRRYGRVRLTLWLIAALGVLWVLVVAPFWLIVRAMDNGNAPVAAFFVLMLVATGITFGAALPFLVLSFVNGLYRERLKGLLHLGDKPLPVVAPPPAMAQVAGG